MMPEPELPRLLRALLRCLPMGERRDEITTDVAELFVVRRQQHGRVHATLRLLGDLASLVGHPPVSAVAASWRVDVRYGLRLFRKHPAVIGAAVGGLALAISVGAVVLSILSASVIRQYGMADPASVVRVQLLFERGLSTQWPYHAFAALRERAPAMRLAASMSRNVPISVSPTAVAAGEDPILIVSGDYLPMLGARPVLGRSLSAADDEPGAAAVAVVNHRFWETRLDRARVGSTLWLAGSALTIVGVVDATFTGPEDRPPAVWVPIGAYSAIVGDRAIDRTSAVRVDVIGRAAADGRVAAQQALSAVTAELPDLTQRDDSGAPMRATGARLDGASSPMDGPDASDMLIAVGILLVIVVLVVALAAANVANLLLAGAASRAREFGVRLAMGASRWRILRQLLTESVLIGLLAGAAGLLLSLWLVPAAGAAIGVAGASAAGLDARVVALTAALAVMAGIVAGVAPARHAARGDLVAVLKSAGPAGGTVVTATRARRWFVGFQAAASMLLLVVAALFLRAALRLVHIDPGFDAERLAVVDAALPPSGTDRAAVAAYWSAARERVRAVPAVEHTALALYAPFGSAIGIREVPRLQRGGLPYRLYENRTDADYFATIGLHLVRGRVYTADEVRADAPVAVVSESIVRDFFGATDPIGASLSAVSASLAPVTVVGVVGEALTAEVRGPGNGAIYRPLSASVSDAPRLLVRAERPAALRRAIESALLDVNPRIRPSLSLVSDGLNEYRNEPKILAGLSGTVALLSLILAVLGLHGVTTFVVRQRLWEVHVRQAIGASAGDIARLLMAQSLTPVAIGLAAGLAIAIAAVRVLTPALAGVNPYDPIAISGAVMVLLAAAAAAVVTPVIRGARSNPAAMLRQS